MNDNHAKEKGGDSCQTNVLSGSTMLVLMNLELFKLICASNFVSRAVVQRCRKAKLIQSTEFGGDFSHTKFETTTTTTATTEHRPLMSEDKPTIIFSI